MARAATTTDVFNAVAEPRRREILELLAAGERQVNDLVAALGVGQPHVSKHLRVLREVGAVQVRDAGRRRLYRVNGAALKPLHDWAAGFEQTWSERFDALDAVLDDLKEGAEDAHQHDDAAHAAGRAADPDDAGARRAAAPRLPRLHHA